MAMGTMISDEMTDHQIDCIVTSLALLPQKVVWAYRGQPPAKLGNNTRLVDWMPQNDFLGKGDILFRRQ